MEVNIRPESHNFIRPTRPDNGSAGYDLYSTVEDRIEPHSRKTIPVGFSLSFSDDYVMLICPRSGLSRNSGITVHNGPGVVDSSYRGEVGVILQNDGPLPYMIKRGDRVGQAVFMRRENVEFNVVDSLMETERGKDGFGSSGK